MLPMSFVLKIGSRPSALALAQTGLMQRRIAELVPGLATEIVPVRTSGDRMATASLARVGGKGLFVKELEQALLDGRADVAVHSMKDLPAALGAAYRIAAVPARENPRDALVSRAGVGIRELGRGARLGTSSMRRRFMALRLNPGLEVSALRGNVDTRLSKVRSGELDAIVIAVAGLVRLGRASEVVFHELDEHEFIPAAAQGALAIETLSDRKVCGSAEIEQVLLSLDDRTARAETAAERAFLATIGASCVTPVGVKAVLRGDSFSMRAILFSLDGERELSDELARLHPSDAGESAASAAGLELGNRMLSRGARELLADG